MVEGGGGKGALEITMNLLMCDKERAPHSLLMSLSLLYIYLTHPKIKKYKYEVNRNGIF